MRKQLTKAMAQYGDNERIRRMAGAFASTNTPEDDVTTANTRASVMVEQETGRRPWLQTDIEYSMIVLATEYMASAELMTRFKDKEKQIASNMSLAKDITSNIVAKRTSEGSKLDFKNVYSSQYKTRSLNPDRDILRTTKYARQHSSTIIGEPF
jgi:translation elongation factor EF-Ts